MYRSLMMILVVTVSLIACSRNEQGNTEAVTETPNAVMPATEPVINADEFIARVNNELKELGKENAAASWIRATYITPDTALIAAKADERSLAYHSAAVKQSRQYAGQAMSEDTARAMKLLKQDISTPAPDDPAKREELTQITARIEGMYGEGKFCPSGPASCRTLNDLERVMTDKEHDYDAQLDAWKGWRSVAPPMREDYRRLVELMNEGARDLGYDNLGILWRDGYDMSPVEFEQETERLWDQVKPLYHQLHCYVRDRLADYYGPEKVSRDGPIPAHLLGNMWAQQWHEIYDILEPYPGVSDLDIDSGLKQRVQAAEQEMLSKDMDSNDTGRAAKDKVAREMVTMAEGFYTSLGMPALPQSFWDQSMFLKPRDREVVCHASAWQMDSGEDVRIKQCIEPTGEELFTIFHELGHVYYDLHYKDQPPLFQGGAHDGFHESVGDTVNLSMTVDYLHKLGLVKAATRSKEATINEQMKLALEKIAFLPFGKMIDQWRWAVFDGRIKPDEYNAAWWELRKKYQGIAAPVQRTENDFDPGAKYHIPANVPYTRYFMSFIMQFQFHKALCNVAGWEGPLYECSVYGNKVAGEKFSAMLALGASRPWQDALEKLTGTRTMEATAIQEYFQPLMTWLEDKNRGKECGWSR